MYHLSAIFLLVSFSLTLLVLTWIWFRHNKHFINALVTSASLVVSMFLGLSGAFFLYEQQNLASQVKQREAFILLLDQEINLIEGKLSATRADQLRLPDTTVTLKFVVIPYSTMQSSLLCGLFGADTCSMLAATISFAKDYNLNLPAVISALLSVQNDNTVENGKIVIRRLKRLRERILGNCKSIRRYLNLTPHNKWIDSLPS